MLALLIGGIAIAAAIVFTAMAYRRRWRWTGLPADPGDGSPADPPRPAKTLWDWLQLLVVPLVLALAAFALNAAQDARDRKQEDRRAAQARTLEARRDDRARALAADRAREDTLGTYIEQMSDLMARSGFRSGRGSGATADETLARTLTLLALRRLDGTRKGLVVQFLKEADLITHTATWAPARPGLRREWPVSTDSKVSLRGADLRGAVMPRFLYAWGDTFHGHERTNAAVLDGADLRDANFNGSVLLGVSFQGADVRGADFSGADISGTSFVDACLSEARFVGANSYAMLPDFSYAQGRTVDFSRARIRNAIFRDAELTDVNLTGAQTGGAAWPRGWTSTGIRMSDRKARTLCHNFAR